jgi:hemerythrin-like domain-containing protein
MKEIRLILTCLFLFPWILVADTNAPAQKTEEEVSANEDLMREHGILNRLLLIYQEVGKRIYQNKPFPLDTLTRSVHLVRSFIENYHEKLEEEFIFPRFEKANQKMELVRVLKDQHETGRQITDYLLSHANEDNFKDEHQKQIVAHYLLLYIRMFRPHEAREDTELFPAFRTLVSPEEYKRLGDQFEERKKQLFGKEGFEKIVNQVTEIEKQLNINNLSQFTPKVIPNSQESK